MVPAEPDPNADPQNQLIPFHTHTHFPGSGDHHYVPLPSAVLSFSTPTLLRDLGLSDVSMVFRPHADPATLQLANFLFNLCST